MADWYTISQTAGTGNAVITVSASANTTSDSFLKRLKVTNSYRSVNVTLSQNNFELIPGLFEVTYLVSGETEEKELYYNAYVPSTASTFTPQMNVDNNGWEALNNRYILSAGYHTVQYNLGCVPVSMFNRWPSSCLPVSATLYDVEAIYRRGMPGLSSPVSGTTVFSAVTIDTNCPLKYIGEEGFEMIGATSIYLPNSLEVLEKNCFSYSKLTTLTIPNSVNSLPEYAFRNMYDLSAITFSSSLTEIPNYVLASSTSRINVLSEISFPASITKIGKDILANRILQTIYSYATTAPTLDQSFRTMNFNSTINGTLHYPAGSDYSTWLSALGNRWTGVADL